MIKWTEILSTDTLGLNRIANERDINPLAVEDCQHRDQQPKLDDYLTHQLLVWFMLADDKLFELQFIIYPDELIVVPHDKPPVGNSWKEFLRVGDHHRDIWHLLYQTLDRATDITWQNLKKVFDQINDFEDKVFGTDFNPQELLPAKKKLNYFDYSFGHLGSVSKQLENLCRPKDDLKWKLRDLHDHCERISRDLTLYRSQIGTIIEMLWGMQANRTNMQIKKLTLLASISVPLTFWSSFWGMNFEFIPYSKPELFFVALAIMAFSISVTIWLIIRKGYWSK